MKAVVNGQRFGFVDRTLVVSGSVGIYYCEFVFDSSWDGWDKTAVFQGCGETIDVVISDGKAQVPWEVLPEQGDGFLRVGVYGTLNGKRMPTIWGKKIPINLGTPTGSIGTEPTPDVYSQILHVANEAKDIAEDANDTATEAKITADEAHEAAITAQDSARASAEAAESSAEDAENSANSASESARQAHESELNAKDHAEDAEDAADRAEQSAAVSGYIFFYIDENGDLIYQRTSNVQVDFALIDGDLYVGAEG